MSWRWMAAGVLGLGLTACGKGPEPKAAARPAAAPVVREAAAGEGLEPGSSPFVPVTAEEAPTEKLGEGTLPDGTFTGALRGDGVSGEVELTVVGGVLTAARAQLDGEPALEVALEPSRLPDDTDLFLMGRKDGEMVRVRGRFVEGERAAGEFEATVGRKGLSGRWYAVRR